MNGDNREVKKESSIIEEISNLLDDIKKSYSNQSNISIEVDKKNEEIKINRGKNVKSLLFSYLQSIKVCSEKEFSLENPKEALKEVKIEESEDSIISCYSYLDKLGIKVPIVSIFNCIEDTVKKNKNNYNGKSNVKKKQSRR